MRTIVLLSVLAIALASGASTAGASAAYIGDCTWGEDNGYGLAGALWDSSCSASHEICLALVGTLCDKTGSGTTAS